MLRKIDTFNSEFISTLDENLRSLFLQSSIVDFQREPFALLASPDENTFPTFEDVLAGTGLIYLQHFLEDKVEFPLLLMWLDIQEFQKIPPQQTTMDYMNRQATKLYDLYIRQGSVDQVPFDRKLIGSILLALESRPSPVLFNPAQDFVEVILRDEVYPQFLSSEPCANLRRDTLTQQQNGGSSAIAEEIARDKQQKIAQLRQASLGKTATTNTPQPRTKEPNINKKPNVSLVSTFGTIAPVLLFTDLLDDSMLVGLFKEFLAANFALESFLFYLEVQQFRTMPQSDFMRTVANKIYSKYIKHGAKMNITYLSEECRAGILSPLSSSTGPTNLLFSVAESSVFHYLSVQKYSEFLKSRQYAEVSQEYLQQVVERQQKRERDIGIQQAQMESESYQADDLAAATKIKLSSGEKLTSDELREKQRRMWEDVTLDLVLTDPLAVTRFKQFATRHACTENLYFWLACEEYRYIPSTAYLKVIASKIYSTHIVKDARLEVNLPGHIYKEIEEGLARPTKKLFSSAQEVIFRLMNASTFPKFLASTEYRSYFEDLQKAAEPQSTWSKLFSGPVSSAVLPPVGTEIAAIRTGAGHRGMSLSYADHTGNRRTSLFIGGNMSNQHTPPTQSQPNSPKSPTKQTTT